MTNQPAKEQAMSKVEVRVKKGDRWTKCNGILAQVRTESDARKAARFVLPDGPKQWLPYEEHEASSTNAQKNEFDASLAMLWLQGMGCTVVEEREEEKANGCERTLFMYKGATGYLNFYDHALSLTTQKMHDIRFVGTTTIHIAGVTT